MPFISRVSLSPYLRVGEWYQPQPTVVTGDQPGSPQFLEPVKGASWGLEPALGHQQALNLIKSWQPQKPSWTETWDHQMPKILESTCSQLSLVMFPIIHDSHEIFNNKNTQIKFLYEMFFTPHTSIINHFNRRKNSAHFHNYLRICF